jgi:1-deoxy-D-xylulose-5-phosphate synthase
MDVPVARIGWPDQFIEHGKVEALRERYGITAEAAARRALRVLQRTKRKMLA